MYESYSEYAYSTMLIIDRDKKLEATRTAVTSYWFYLQKEHL